MSIPTDLPDVPRLASPRCVLTSFEHLHVSHTYSWSYCLTPAYFPRQMDWISIESVGRSLLGFVLVVMGSCAVGVMCTVLRAWCCRGGDEVVTRLVIAITRVPAMETILEVRACRSLD